MHRAVGSIKKLGGASVSRGTFRMRRATKKIFLEMLAAGRGRAVASMYSSGGVGQKFRNDEKNSEYFMAYEATKVFAIRKMKTQF
jgi:O-phosphoseryl-tRNA(Cys) synthetase